MTATKRLIEFLDKINTPLYSIIAQKMLEEIKGIVEDYEGCEKLNNFTTFGERKKNHETMLCM